MKPLLLAPTALLAACVSATESCSSYGFEPGTDAYAECMMRIEMDNADRRLAMAQHMQRASTPTFSAPRITTCRPIAGGVQCY